MSLSILVRNLAAIENPEPEGPIPNNKDPGLFENADGDGSRPTVVEVEVDCSSSWTAANHFIPPGPAF